MFRKIVFNNCAKNQLYLTSIRQFYNPWKTGSERYERQKMKEQMEMTELDKLLSGWQVFKKEFKLWIKEWKEHPIFDSSRTFNIYDDNEIVKYWHFDQRYNHKKTSFYNVKDADTNDLPKWHVVSDSYWNDGFSSVSLTVSPAGRALVSGNLDTRVPQHGFVGKAGWVFFACEKERKSFYRSAYFDWDPFTHLVVKVRGDGRIWKIMLDTSWDDDLTWFDRYSFRLYTRGGPYWQICKIPFSKFFLTNKQAIQDKQSVLPQIWIRKIGFLLADNIAGPFSLEVEYVGCVNEVGWTEQFNYEMYYAKENTFPQPLSTIP